METANPAGDEAAEITQIPNAEPRAAEVELAAEAARQEPIQQEPVQPEPRSSRRWIGLIPTAIFGILMFVLGGVGGFVGRPYIMVPTPTLTAAQDQQGKMQALLDMLISKTRHFKGNANAPVTLLEFGDFQ
jgi:hypothetical protein